MQTPDFIRRTDTGASPLGLRAHAPRVLEVHALWEDLLLDTRHFAAGSNPVRIGEAMAWRWRCLGIDMGPIPAGVRHLAAVTPPLWSEVEQSSACEFFAPADQLGGVDSHELVSWDGDDAMVEVPDGWTVEIGGHDRPWAFVAETRIAVPADALLRLRSGDLSLVMRRVRAPRGVAGRPELGGDAPFAGMFSFVALVGLLFGFAMANTAPPPTNEVVEVPERVMSLVFQKPEPPPPAQPTPAAAKPKAKGEEGKPGKKDGAQVRAKARKGSEEDRQAVDRSGIFAAWGDPALAGLSDGGLADGLADSLGGLHGPRGTQIGTGGLGRRGLGDGGGGDAETTHIGGTCIGDVAKCGTAAFGAPGGDVKGSSAVPKVSDAIIIGGLDRQLIDEEVKRHMASIRYCYQRELQKQPGLGGKLVVQFTIAKDGSVSQAKAKRSTVGSAEVDECVVGRFLRMGFPEPRGGGIVMVSYPFLFAPG